MKELEALTNLMYDAIEEADFPSFDNPKVSDADKDGHKLKEFVLAVGLPDAETVLQKALLFGYGPAEVPKTYAKVKRALKELEPISQGDIHEALMLADWGSQEFYGYASRTFNHVMLLTAINNGIPHTKYEDIFAEACVCFNLGSRTSFVHGFNKVFKSILDWRAH